MKSKTLRWTPEVIDTPALGRMKGENALKEGSWNSSEKGEGGFPSRFFPLTIKQAEAVSA